jgi:aspartate racemase
MLKKAELLLYFSILPFIFFLSSFSSNVFHLDNGGKNTTSQFDAKEVSSDKIEGEKKMKVIGLLGGITWHSTADYYKQINQLVNKRLGGFHSAHILIYSVDFAVIEHAQREGRWDDIAQMLTEAAKALKAAGADFLIISANTIHKVAPEIEKGSGLHILHVADVTGESIKKQGLKKVGLLGTRFTMKEEFYTRRLGERYNLEVLVPGEKDQEIVNTIIFNELAKGVVNESSRQAYVEVVNRLVERGAEGIILGCTEIPQLIRPSDVDIPLFDTTCLHVEATVEFALSGGSEL